MSKRNPQDWVFGQRVIESDYASIAQVRECLAIQDKIWAMGEEPKPLADILIDKGYLRDYQAAMVREIMTRGEAPKSAPEDDTMETVFSMDNVPPVSTSAPAHPAPTQRLPVRHTSSHPPRLTGRRKAWLPQSSFSFGSLAVVALLILGLMGGAYWYFFMREPKDAGRTGSGPSNTRSEAYGAVPKNELRKITALAELDGKTFDKYREVIDQFEGYQGKYKGTAWFDKAYEEQKKYQSRVEEYAARVLQSLRDREKPYRSRGQFLEVIKIYREFPSILTDGTPAGIQVKEELQALGERFHEQLQLDRAELEQMISAKRYDAALEKIASMELYAEDSQRARLAERKAELQKLRDQQAVTLFGDMTAEYAKLTPGFRNLFQERKYQDVLNSMIAFLKDKRYTSYLPRVLPPEIHTASFWTAMDKRDIAAAWGICKPVMLRLKTQDLTPGSLDLQARILYDLSDVMQLELLMDDVRKAMRLTGAAKETVRLSSLGGQEGTFSEEQGKFFFSPRSGEKKEIQLRGSLVEEDVEQLAIRSLDPDRSRTGAKLLNDPTIQARLGLLYYYSGKSPHLPRAYSYLKKAQTLGETWLVLYVLPLERMVEPLKDASLRAKFEQAKEAVKKQQFADAKKLLLELKGEAAGTAFGREQMAAVELALRQLDETVAEEARAKEKIKSLEKENRCRVEWMAKDTYKFSYDFVSNEQFGAFDLITKEDKGQWMVFDGALRGVRSPALMWKRKIAGDVVVEFKLTMIEDQNMLVNLFYRPKEERYYAFALGLRVADRDADRQMGLPAHAIMKDPKPPGQDELKKPEAWEKFKKQILSREARALTIVKHRTYTVRIERTGEDLRLNVDGALICEAKDKDYTEGHLVLSLSQSNVRIDDLSITTKVEK